MQTAFHIHFNGQCREAFNFYREHLGATIVSMLTVAESPAASQFPKEWQGKIINAGIELNGIAIGGGDVLPDQYQSPAGFNVLLRVETETETMRIFERLSEQGEVVLPLQSTFWSRCYGIVVDQFRVPWKLNCMRL